MHIDQFFHILNPNQAKRPAVRRFFGKNKQLAYVWVERTSHPTHLETVIEWALGQGHRRLAVWGGDGTFSRTVQALYEMNRLEAVTLVLIPVGTGNDFARKVGLNPWTALLKCLFTPQDEIKEFDLGLLMSEAGERIFVNNAGFGRTAEAVRDKASRPLHDILNFKVKRIEAEWETATTRNVETLRALMGIVFNAPYFNKGMVFDPSIEPNDGRLNVVLIPPQNRWRLLFRFVGSRLGFGLGHPSDIKFDGESIKMESLDEFYPQVDGEPAGMRGVQRLNFEVKKGWLKLLVPGVNN